MARVWCQAFVSQSNAGTEEIPVLARLLEVQEPREKKDEPFRGSLCPVLEEEATSFWCDFA